MLEHLESEIHYIFFCCAYSDERDDWLRKLTLPPNFDHTSIENKLKVVLNDPRNVKLTAQFISTAYDIRSKIINK